ncbi:MAG: DUF2520 domain-containing protein [Lachnospiraceae bacterium]|nr:DUF2520 domain-containing protein [Lachnospiraceae bacterium]
MHIGIIGAGKVGCSIGKYLVDSGISVKGYYSKTRENAAAAAAFTGTEVFENVGDIVSASDTLFITTPDDRIGDVWDCIAKYNIEEKIVCHFSGSLSSVVFSGIEEKGASGCSIHPMLAFSDRFSSYRQLNNAIFTIEGMKRAVDTVKGIFESTGNTVLKMKSEEKSRYHAAASILSNQMIALYQIGIDNLVKCGFDEEDAKMLIKPLVKNNVDAFLEKGSVNALTGPVERNDISTVRKHLDVLSGDDREIYRLLGKKLVSVAQEKNQDRNYEKLKEVFMERKTTK